VSCKAFPVLLGHVIRRLPKTNLRKCDSAFSVLVEADQILQSFDFFERFHLGCSFGLFPLSYFHLVSDGFSLLAGKDLENGAIELERQSWIAFEARVFVEQEHLIGTTVFDDLLSYFRVCESDEGCAFGRVSLAINDHSRPTDFAVFREEVSQLVLRDADW